MKYRLVASLFTLLLSSCSNDSYDKHQQMIQSNKFISNKNSGTETNMQINGMFQVRNELNEDQVEIYAYDANKLKDGVYYFKIMIKNKGAKPITIVADQIILVDQYGQEHSVGLVDYELLSSIGPHAMVGGLVGFEGLDALTPSFLKFKKV